MKNIIVYSTPACPYCVAARNLLSGRGLKYTEFDVSRNPNKREEMNRLSNRRTVPQIFIDNQHIGGFTDLIAHFASVVA